MTPIGLNCPQCNQPPIFLFGNGTQAFCGTDGCPVLTWDPTGTRDEFGSIANIFG